MERERPNVRPARLGFPVVKMGPSQSQGIYLQVLDSDGNAPAATGKKDFNNELRWTSHLREAGAWNGPRQYAMCVPCVAGSNRGDSRSPLHSSGVLITRCRESYARQATREKRVRETIQHATCVPCVMLEREGLLRST
jgi:hypothetical protein